MNEEELQNTLVERLVEAVIKINARNNTDAERRIKGILEIAMKHDISLEELNDRYHKALEDYSRAWSGQNVDERCTADYLFHVRDEAFITNRDLATFIENIEKTDIPVEQITTEAINKLKRHINYGKDYMKKYLQRETDKYVDIMLNKKPGSYFRFSRH